MLVGRFALLERLALGPALTADPAPSTINDRPSEQVCLGADGVGSGNPAIGGSCLEPHGAGIGKGQLHAAAYADRQAKASNAVFESVTYW